MIYLSNPPWPLFREKEPAITRKSTVPQAGEGVHTYKRRIFCISEWPNGPRGLRGKLIPAYDERTVNRPSSSPSFSMTPVYSSSDIGNIAGPKKPWRRISMDLSATR